MQNSDIINKIIEAEHRAQQIVADATEKEAHLDETTKAEISQLKEEYKARVGSRLSLVEKQEKQIAEEKVAEFEAAHKLRLEKIEASYEQRKTIWLDELFATLVNS